MAGCRETLTDAHVEAIVGRCVALTELDVSDAVKLTDASVETVVAGLPLLQYFGASRCYKILPATYLLFDEHRGLQYLHMFGVLKEPALEELKSRLPKIVINKFLFSSVARPTVGLKRTSIWGVRARDNLVET
jgi:F-box and leucine-rich repeat protein 1 (S-phase kinase-associated protein 2)